MMLSPSPLTSLAPIILLAIPRARGVVFQQGLLKQIGWTAHLVCGGDSDDCRVDAMLNMNKMINHLIYVCYLYKVTHVNEIVDHLKSVLTYIIFVDSIYGSLSI